MGLNRTYAIGDIHGHLDKLHEVHRWIDRDRRDYFGEVAIVHVGDLVDRGPDSAGVIDLLMSGIALGEPWVVLKGNHDRMMSLFLETPPRRDPGLRAEMDWLDKRIGGRTTLASYGVDSGEDRSHAEIHEAAKQAVPVEHLAFLAGLDTMYQAEGLAYVHAGIRPGVALDQQSEDDLVWIRKPFHEAKEDFDALIVHGHTPVDAVTHYGNRINLDTGVAYGGPLSAIVAEDGAVWCLDENGRQPLNITM